MLQKGYTVDFLTKKTKKNEGEVPQYYVDGSHPAIVALEVYDMVQAEIERRKAQGGKHSGLHCFSGKVFCGSCSSTFGSKVWHSTSKYRRTIWRCNQKYNGSGKCLTPHLIEDDLKRLLVEAFNRLYSERISVMEEHEEIIAALTDTASLDKRAAALAEERAVVTKLIRKGVEENACVTQNQDEYRERHEGLIARYEAVQKQLDSVTAEKQTRNTKR